MRHSGRSCRLPRPGAWTTDDNDELLDYHKNNDESWRLSGSDELSFRQSDADGRM